MDSLRLKASPMAARGKARVPSESELKRLFSVARNGLHGLRNGAVLAVSYRLGLRAKEISALRIADVVDAQGNLRDECALSAAATKGGRPRIAYLSNPALRWALKAYLDGRRKAEGLQFDL